MNQALTQKELNKRIWLTVLAILVFICLVLTLFLHKMFTPRIMSVDELRANGAIVFDKPRIIKDFNLIDHHGNDFNVNRFNDKWTLLYYGFTHCPDICPTTLADVSRVVEKLNEDIAESTQVVMITADPARDTVDVLSQYMPFFNKDFIGVTGDFLPIRSLASNLNVAFNKVVIDKDNADVNYTIDHTGNLILINPKGHYHGFFKPPFELSKLKTTYQSIVTSFDY